MELHLIWAQDRAGAIGRNNAIPWHLPEDLRRFRQTTLGSPVIMGRRTMESLGSCPLPGRLNIVLTRTPGYHVCGAAVACCLADGFALALSSGAKQAFVIGGAALYDEAMQIASQLFVTEVDLLVESADTQAPVIPARDFSMLRRGDWLTSESGLRYRFARYQRKAPLRVST